jgi:hypothetical protein
VLVSCFILLNFLAMIRVHVPLNYKFFQTIYRPVDAYLSYFSLYQDWMMFAPNPGRLNVFITAEVEFDDGTKDTYVFPRSSELSLGEKYVYGEKFRKIVSEGIRRDSHQFLWPGTAKFALRKLKERNSFKVPMRVDLYRHWNEVPSIEERFLTHFEKQNRYDSYRFYSYEVF